MVIKNLIKKTPVFLTLEMTKSESIIFAHILLINYYVTDQYLYAYR